MHKDLHYVNIEATCTGIFDANDNLIRNLTVNRAIPRKGIKDEIQI